MKKIIMACGVAAMLASMASCGKGASEGSGSTDDSIVTLFGTINGADLAQAYAGLDSTQKAQMSKADVLAGIKAVLMTDTAENRKGYISGMQIGMGILQNLQMMQQADVKIDRDLLYKSLSEAFSADSVKDLALKQNQLQSLMMGVQAKAMEKQEAEQRKKDEEKAQAPEAKANMKAGADYVAKQMAADPKIVKTESGIAYKVLKEGNGANPSDGDIVSVIYEGKLIDGTVFDSSAGKAVQFPVSGVIPGFSEMLKLMKPGEKVTVYIPGPLAYGVNGTPDGKIGPNATLVFDLTLESIQPQVR